MIQILENLGIVKNESNRGFKMAPAIIMLIILATFVGTTFYILFASLE